MASRNLIAIRYVFFIVLGGVLVILLPFIPQTFVEAEDADTQVTVTNSNVIIFKADAEVYASPHSSSASPINVGEMVTFHATGDDPTGDDYYVISCRSDSITPDAGGGVPTCDGGAYCVSGPVADESEGQCSYTVQDIDAESSEWFVFVCDAVIGQLCSTSSSGTISDASHSPFVVNHRASFASIADDGGTGGNTGANPGGSMIFTATANDADSLGSKDNLTLVVCKSNSGATKDGCTSGQLCISSPTSTNPRCTHTVPLVAKDGSFQYYAYLFDSHGLPTANSPLSGTYVINNVPPAVSNVRLNNNVPIRLIEGSNRTIVVSGTISDANSCQDIGAVKAHMYRSGIGFEGCNSTNEQNENSCYPQITCTTSSCSGNTDGLADYTCSISVPFTADPTDINTQFDTQSWLTTITAADESHERTNELASGVEIQSLTALNVPHTLDFGSLTPGTNTSGNTSLLVESKGNVGIDVELSGSELTRGSSLIPLQNQQYALTAFSVGEGILLTGFDAPKELEINIGKNTSPSSLLNGSIFWGIIVPPNSSAGLYTGRYELLAVKGEVEEW